MKNANQQKSKRAAESSTAKKLSTAASDSPAEKSGEREKKVSLKSKIENTLSDFDHILVRAALTFLLVYEISLYVSMKIH